MFRDDSELFTSVITGEASLQYPAATGSDAFTLCSLAVSEPFVSDMCATSITLLSADSLPMYVIATSVWAERPGARYTLVLSNSATMLSADAPLLFPFSLHSATEKPNLLTPHFHESAFVMVILHTAVEFSCGTLGSTLPSSLTILITSSPALCFEAFTTFFFS